jgi:hypothetical protein
MTLAARGSKLGSGTFAVPLAETRTVKVKLSRKARKRLKRRKERVAVTVTLADQAPVTVVKTLKTR